MASAKHRLRVVDAAGAAAPRREPVQLICKRPACSEPIPERTGPGGPQEFCSTQCKGTARKEHDEALRSLRRAEAVLAQFGRPAVRPAVSNRELPPEAEALAALARDLLAAASSPVADDQWRIILSRLVQALPS
jgi:hypothetical protein